MADDMAGKKYRLAAHRFDQERSRLLSGFYAAFLMAVVAVLMLEFRNLDFSPGWPLMVSLAVITVSVMFTVSIAFWSIFRSLRLHKQAWLSFELLLEQDRIVRRMADREDLSLLRSNITGFDETVGRGFYIKTSDAHNFVYVPAALEGYDDLKRELSRWQQFPKPRLREPIWRSPFFVGAACLAAWSVLWFSADKAYVLASAFVLVVFLLSTFIAVVRSPRASASMRRSSWIYLVIAGVALLRVVTLFRQPQ
jgi:hypothetical protein